MASAAFWILAAFSAVAFADGDPVVDDSGPPCPARCMCFKTTVRCMHLHLSVVPLVPYNTTVLDLRFNKIKTITPGTFKKLRRLTTLLLNDNQLQTLKDETFQGLSELKHLYLYKNKIREISGRALDGMPRLEQLYLHYNKIGKIEPHVFDKMQRLQRLFLHENKLRHIYPGTFETLPSLQRLRIDGNAFVCDCNLKWFKHLISERMKGIQITATCQYPDDPQAKSPLDLNFESLHCNEPHILEGPQDTLVNLGNLAKLTCRVYGDPMPRVKWMLNSNEIDRSDPKYSIEDDGSLVVASTSENDLGTYQCVAESSYGTTMSDPAKMSGVSEHKHPDFVRRPIDQTVKEGETVQLECSISGPNSLNITWAKDGVPLSSSRSHQSPEGTLTMYDVTLEDSGLYHCTVPLQDGSAMSTPARLTVNAPPKITTSPENQWVNRGDQVKMRCVAFGNPHPVITWFKDGRSVQPTSKLKLEAENTQIVIQRAEDSDAGLYTCLAQSIHGTAESNGELRVRPTGPQAPVLITTPYSLVSSLGSAVEFPCKARGEPFPAQEWRKNGEPLVYDSTHKVFPSGSLRLYNISLGDEGVYECKATNDHGSVSVEATLRIRGINDVDDTIVFQALDEAQVTVDRAVNATIAALFHSNITKNPGTLMTIFRYPDPTSRAAVRAADIYENTLLNIRRQISAGAQVEPKEDFKYEDILTPHQLQLIANLSGCMEHQVANCSNMCFHSQYRTVDGTCNNMQHPYWGASLTGFRRLLSPIYENGFSQPVGWNKKRLYNGYPLPPARLVSTTIIRTTKITADTQITHMVMQWGQFLDHDLDHAIPSTTAESWEGLDCKKSCDSSPPCFPMDVPHGDNRITERRCMDFIRSSAICGSGITSVFFNKIMPREQINQLTAYIDGSQVYGFTTNRSILLRDYSADLGLLRTGIPTLSGKPLLPIAGAQEVDCRRDPTESEIGCFLAGDIRVNEQISLAAMHTIWLREHNRIAEELKHVNPHWNGDKIFNEARKIVGAEMQHITYKHWLPLVLGPEGMELLGPYKGYDPNVNPGISNEFATAAFRFGHTLINPILARLNESFQTIPEGDLPLGKAFFVPWRLVDEGGVDPLMRGMFASPAKRKRPDENLNDQLTDHLFTSFHAVALDLASMNVQRSRDHGIPFYNDYRKWCGLSSAETFEDLKKEISDEQSRRKLQELYGHPGNIDIFVGGILEDQLEGARFGPLFRCIIVDQFKRIRAGDRFWYESPAAFTPAQFTQISQGSLARILCDNGDNITQVTKNVFLLPEVQPQGVVNCQDIPRMDLRFWYECPDCHNDSRSRRDLNHNGTMEDRMDALEEMVKKLQKTIKNLRRKIRSMPQSDSCLDDRGKPRSDGETWRTDNCTFCECQESRVKCTRLQCAPLKCEKTVLEEGKCCPVCA